MVEVVTQFRSSPSEVFFGKRVLKISRKFTIEHPRRSAISIKLLSIKFSEHLFLGTALDGCFWNWWSICSHLSSKYVKVFTLEFVVNEARFLFLHVWLEWKEDWLKMFVIENKNRIMMSVVVSGMYEWIYEVLVKIILCVISNVIKPVKLTSI